MNQNTRRSTNHPTSPPQPPLTTPSSSSRSPLPHPSSSHQTPFPNLSKPFDAPPHRPSSTYPSHLNLPSVNPTPNSASAVTSLQQKQLKDRTIERPWASMWAQQASHASESYPSPSPSTSAYQHASPSSSHPLPPASHLDPLARWRTEPGVQGPYHAIASVVPTPRTTTSPRTHQQRNAPSRAPAARGSWDGYDG
ncbi:hypothetical protein MMC30_004242 [Trapelia coarctata]|nr:hypothetical protein [Trapelia coarctata]